MTVAIVSEKCVTVDDLSRLPLRELIALARARLGSGAARLKTRAEFLDVLRGGVAPAQPSAELPAAPSPMPVVTRDFFVARPK